MIASSRTDPRPEPTMYTTNKPSPLEDDGFTDEIEAYNKELASLDNPTWFKVPWLFSENYLYR